MHDERVHLNRNIFVDVNTAHIKVAMQSNFFRFFAIFFLVIAIFPFSLRGESPAPQPQMQLERVSLRVGTHHVEAQLADTEESRSIGLMFRDTLQENEGMLFVFPRPHQATFWMKNTRIPLSIAFIDRLGVILEIREMQAGDETLTRSGFDTVLYALEMAKGWFAKNRIFAGDRIEGLPSGAHRH